MIFYPGIFEDLFKVIITWLVIGFLIFATPFVIARIHSILSEWL